ncbi:MAG TPA: hypothetical protein VFA98_11105 [Thermoanaerobaculia bacterium]|nr:hypothetical protein [Thermoanaerobaculia bacterium]
MGSPTSLRVAVGALALFSSCRSAAPPKPAEPSVTGRATYEAVMEPSVETSTQVTQRLFIPAEPGDANRPPRYPEELLGLKLPPQKIVVRISLDERGRIADVKSIPGASEADSNYREAFEAAIRTAIDGWRFKPAVQRTFVDSPDDGSGKPPYKMLKAETPVPTYFDIRFVFEVSDGKGLVRQAQ